MTSPSKSRALALAHQHLEAAQYMTEQDRHEQAYGQWVKAAEQFETAEDLPYAREARMRAGLAAYRFKNWEQASESLQQAVALARQAGETAELAICLSHLGMVTAKIAPSKALAVWEEGLALAQTYEMSSLVGVLALNLGRTSLSHHRYEEARTYFRSALEQAQASENSKVQADVLNALGDIQRAQGEHDASTETYQEAFEAAHLAGDVGLMAQSLASLGNAFRLLGDLERAEQRLGSALSFAKVLGDQVAMGSCHVNLGNVFAGKGDFDQAQREYMSALTLYKRLKNDGALVGVLANLGSLRASRGDIEGARRFYQDALNRLGESQWRVRADLLLLLGQLEARSGRLTEAEALFQASLQAAQASDYRACEVRVHMCQAALQLASGKVSAALSSYEDILPHLGGLESASDRVMGHLAYVDAALVASRPELASGALASARELMGPPMEERLQRERLDLEAMSARVAWVRTPNELNAAVLKGAEAQFRAAGRVGDAWALALARWDVLEPQSLEQDALQEARNWAWQHHLTPALIEFESLLALAQGLEPARFEPWLSTLEELGLRLVWLKVARRQLLVMPSEQREGRRQELLALAQTFGAESERQRLMRLS